MASPFEHKNESDTVISFQLPYLGMETTNTNTYATQPVETPHPVETPPINNFSKKPFTFGQPTSAGMTLGVNTHDPAPAFGCMGNISSKKVEPGFQSFMTSTMTSTSGIPTLGCNLGQPPKVQYYTFNPQTGYKPVDVNTSITLKSDKKIIINSLYDELKRIRGQIELLNKSTDEIYHIIRNLNETI